MNELLTLCQEKGYTLRITINEHKKDGVPVREFVDKYFQSEFVSKKGQKWVEIFEKADTLLTAEVYNGSQDMFMVFDVDLNNLIQEAIDGIRQGLEMKQGDAPIDNFTHPALD